MIPTQCEVGPCLIRCQDVVLMVMVNMPRDYHDQATHIYVSKRQPAHQAANFYRPSGVGDWQINVDATNASTSSGRILELGKSGSI